MWCFVCGWCFFYWSFLEVLRFRDFQTAFCSLAAPRGGGRDEDEPSTAAADDSSRRDKRENVHVNISCETVCSNSALVERCRDTDRTAPRTWKSTILH